MEKPRKTPLLFEKYPALEGRIPWTCLAPLKTPVQECVTLEKKLGLDSLWIKRDDLTSPLYGGNKVRKLEFILADVKNKGCDKVIAVGGIGSNHCVANGIFCRELDLEPIAGMVNQPLTTHVRKNLLLDLHFRNEIIYARGTAGLIPKILGKYLRSRSTYLMMPGGSSPLGTLGFVNAALELKEQVDKGELPEPDHIFVACGSCGTAAGLALGVKLAGMKTRVHAVQVSFALFSGTRALNRTARGAWKLVARHEKTVPNMTFGHLVHEPGYFGETYGKPTREGLDAVRLLKEMEDITLEATYTGKAFAALNGFVRGREDELKDKTLLYWHTYNSRDFSDIVAEQDYHDLPNELHWVFETPLPDFGLKES